MFASLNYFSPLFKETGPPKSNNLSKGGILARACEFINELHATNRNLMAKLGGGLTVRETDNMRLQCQVHIFVLFAAPNFKS